MAPASPQFQSISKVVADSTAGEHSAAASQPAPAQSTTWSSSLGRMVPVEPSKSGGAAIPPKANPNSGLSKPSRRPSRRLLGVIGALIVLAIVAGAGFLLTKKNPQTQSTANANQQYTPTSIPLGGLSASGQLTTGSNQQFSVNGQLRINNTAVVAPTATPNAPELGQIYLSNTNNGLYYYNGTSFVPLGSSVLSVQGQTGAISFTAGGGVSVNGTTITNTGVTSLSGTANQISVSAANGAVTLSLPQSIGAGSAPTFAALQVGSLTARPGDSGLVVGNGTQDLSLQGANTTISDSAGGFSTQIVFATPTANATLIVPNVGGTICTTSGNCGGGGASVELQATSPGIAQTGNINVSGTIIAGAFSGDGSAIVNLNAANVTTGTLAVANGGTGAANPANARTNLGAAASGINADITSLTDLSSITPSGGLTIGSSTQSLTLQGSAATTFSVANAGFTTTLEFAQPTADTSIIVPNNSGTVAVAASGPLALDSNGNLTCANCLVSSTSGGGTAGVVSVNSFTGAITIAHGVGLSLTNNSGTVTVAADQDISTTATPTFAGLSLNGDLGVGVGTPQYPIDVNGDINVSGAFRINGASICTSGGCTASGGSGSYIQDGTSIQTANFAIQGGGSGNIVALVRGALGQTANIFAVQTSTGTNLLSVTSGGQVGVATASPNYPLDVNGDINTNGSLRISGTAVCSSTSGCTPAPNSNNYIQNSTSLQVANFGLQSAGASNVGGVIRGASSQTADLLQTQANDGTVLFSSSANGNGYFAGSLGIATTTPGYTLDVQGSGNINAATALYIGGTQICTSSGCVAGGGSGSYIQNGTTVQTNANLAIQSHAAASVAALIQGAASQSADLLELQTSTGTNEFRVTPAGAAYVATNLVVGSVASPTYSLEVAGDANVTGDYRINGVAVCTSSGCSASGGSGNYIQNTTTLESENYSIQSAAATTSPTAVIQQATSQTGDLLDLNASNGSIVASINPSGQLRVGGATAYTSALNVGTNTTNALGGITLGTDTDLYRSASGTLKTDGTFQAAALQESAADFATGLQLQSTTAASTRSTNLTFTDNQATPQSISLRKEGSNLVVLDNSGNVQLGFSPGSAGLLFGTSLDTDLYRSGANALTTDGALTVAGAFTGNGPTVFKNTSNSVTAFTVQNAAGTNLFVADTTDQRIGIDTTSPPAFPLDVNGTINTSTQYDIGGTQVCSSSGCTAASGSGYYIQNGTAPQTANFSVLSAAIGSVGGVIQGASGQTADLLDLKNGSGVNVATVGATGNVLVEPSTNSTTAFQIQNATDSSNLFDADTTNTRIGIGTNTPGFTLDVAGTINTNSQYDVSGVQIASTNLSDGSNLAKLNGTGPQIFTGNNKFTGSGDSSTVAGSGILLQNTANSTNAFEIQNALGTSNLLIADTTNTKIGIGGAPVSTGNILQVTGGISASTNVLLNASANNTGRIDKLTTVGTGGVTAGDVVVLNSSAQAVDTTTARDTRVYGVAISTKASAATDNVTIAGDTTVNASAVSTPINIGDQLVASTTSGDVVSDNAATTGILGTALSALASGTGTVSVAVRPVGGQSTPIFSPQSNSTTAFQIQNATRSTTLFDADTTNSLIGIAAAPTAGGSTLQVAGTISTTGTITVGTNTNLSPTALVIGGVTVCTSSGCGATGGSGSYIQNGTVTQTGNFNIQSTSAGSVAAVIQGATSQTADLLDLLDGSGNTVHSVGATGSTTVKTTTNSSTAFQVQNALGTSALSVNTSNLTTTVQAGTDNPTLGSNLITITDFCNAAWTTTNWTLSPTCGTPPATSAQHNTGNVSALSTNQITPVNGSTYLVSFTVANGANLTNGMTVTFGGQTVDSFTFASNTPSVSESKFITATGAGNLTFTPSANGFNGAISAVSVQLLTQAPNPVLVVKNASGTTNIEVRASSDTSNMFIGLSSGISDIGSTGIQNTALGNGALQANTNGLQNVAIGGQALQFNTVGTSNTAVGYQSMQNTTTGTHNTAIGTQSLQANTTGAISVAVGYQALFVNTSGTQNTAVGSQAMLANTTGSVNAALGQAALRSNTTGSNNSALGTKALTSVTTGSNNLGVGVNTGTTNVGTNALTTGSGNTFLGNQSGPGQAAYQISTATAIGIDATVNQSNAVILGCTTNTATTNSCGAQTTVGIGSAYAPSALTVNPNVYGTNGTSGTASTIQQTTTTITGTSTAFTAAMVGGTVYYSDGTTSTISSVNVGAQTMVVSVSKTVTAGSTYTIVYGGFNVNPGGTTLLQPTTDSTSAFQIQNTSGTAFFTADSSNLKVTVTNLVITASLTVNGHVITGNSSGSTTAAVNANAGTGGSPSCTVSGNDTGGQITLVTGTSAYSAGTQCTITFANSYAGTAPHPVITPANSTDTSTVKPYVTVPGSTPFTTFTISFVAADSAQHTFVWNYFNAQ